MKTLFEELKQSKAQIIITLCSGQQLRLNLGIYSLDLSKSNEYALFSYNNNEYIIIRYSEIAMIQYVLKPCMTSQ